MRLGKRTRRLLLGACLLAAGAAAGQGCAAAPFRLIDGHAESHVPMPIPALAEGAGIAAAGPDSFGRVAPGHLFGQVDDPRRAFRDRPASDARRFGTVASGNGTAWNPRAMLTQFAIEPQLFRTAWFPLLCTVVALLLAAIVYLWRLRQLSERIRMRLEERVNERERIARDLHDTLLQGVQGLLLRLQVLSKDFDAGDGRRQRLDEAIAGTRAMLVEGRDKIMALRGEDPARLMLSQALRAIGGDLASAHSARFRVEVEGAEKPLCPPACDEVLDIAREAIRNAFLHAEARSIEARVKYGENHLRIIVRDDGRGIDPEWIRLGRREGHWGLVGMHERSRQLGGTLLIRRLKSGGTEVVLVVLNQVVFVAPS